MRLNRIATALIGERDLDPQTENQYLRACRRFGEFLGRPADLQDLNTEQVNSFLRWLKTNFDLSGTSICNHRAAILRVWNYAVDAFDAEPYQPKRIRKPKTERAAVVAWDLGQFNLLMDAAKTISGRTRCGIVGSELLLAWLRVGYDTGMRPTDLRLLQWEQVDEVEGVITITQHKTSRPHTALVGPEALAALRELRKYNRERVFPLSKGGFRRWELKLFSAARKLGFSRRKRQGIGTLRKTHATEVCREHGVAAAAESLGHYGSQSTARNHYIDSRITNRGTLPPSPPNAES